MDQEPSWLDEAGTHGARQSAPRRFGIPLSQGARAPIAAACELQVWACAGPLDDRLRIGCKDAGG
jgi:hypothetical protein